MVSEERGDLSVSKRNGGGGVRGEGARVVVVVVDYQKVKQSKRGSQRDSMHARIGKQQSLTFT